MQLDEGEVHLKPGDAVIQRGTNHNWVNRGTEPCVMAFVLIATEGGKSTDWRKKPGNFDGVVCGGVRPDAPLRASCRSPLQRNHLLGFLGGNHPFRRAKK